jgi:8-amino-7-oxononanoate synthase
MSVFDRCGAFNSMVKHIQAQNQFFYLREVDPTASAVVTLKGKKTIMLGSNNYLGLSNHPRVIEMAIKALREYGAGACSSRVLTGTSSLHNQAEKKLAEFKGMEDSVIFSTGFMTMMGTVSTLTGEGDVILSDQLNHASIVEGCRLSKAEKKLYRHNDMSSLREELAKCKPGANKLIVTDGVFSMKGSVANLPEIKKLADEFDAQIMVDDAHGTGVLGARGRGICEHYHMESQIDLMCGTFSKTLSTIGGFTAAKSDVVTFLKLNSRPFVFTASPPPSVIATVLACLEVIEQEPQLIKKLFDNTDFMKTGLKEIGYKIEETITPIIPIIINDDEKAFMMTGLLEQEGVLVNPIVPPAVPKDSSVIRISLMASLSKEDLQTALDKLKAVGEKLRII